MVGRNKKTQMAGRTRFKASAACPLTCVRSSGACVSIPFFQRALPGCTVFALVFVLLVTLLSPSFALANEPDDAASLPDSCAVCSSPDDGVEKAEDAGVIEGHDVGNVPEAAQPQGTDNIVAVLSDNRLHIRLGQQGDTDSGNALGDKPANASLADDGQSAELPATFGAASATGQYRVFSFGDGTVKEGANVPWYEQRGAVQSVSFGEGVRPVSMARWFSGHDKLAGIEFKGLDTCRVTSMDHLFAGCSSITSLDLSSFDTSSVTSMNGMFSGCSALKTVDLSSFDTCNVADMCDMFSGCSSVKSLDLSSFDTANVRSLDRMFSGCTSLAALDVSGFTPEQLNAAAVPTGNEGGYWRMNVPPGYDPGIQLREPTSEERAAAGLPSEDNTTVVPDNVTPLAQPTSRSGQVQAAVSASGQGEAGAMSGSAVEEDAVSRNVTDVLSAIAAAMAGPMASLGADRALDVGDIASAGTAVLDVFGANSVVDKTMAMIIAAFGMIAAAALLLTLCFKIR